MSEILKKKDFIRDLSQRTGLNIKDTENIVDVFQSTIVKHIEDGFMVRLDQLGSFKKVVKPQRQARNPKTGKVITVPERSAIKFKAIKKIIPFDC